jgi:mitogen-activated protein kinase kinase kinase ANP1
MSVEDVSSRELKSLQNEINLLRNLQHPNIVRYIGTEVNPSSLSIFLEYIPGGSLKSLIEKFGCLEEAVVRTYSRQLLLGLEYLHRSGFAHRDIKGANCLVGNDGVIKLADFGASKHWRSTAAVSGANLSQKSGEGITGTPSWMAPEVIRDQDKQIPWKKADVWSLGCTV